MSCLQLVVYVHLYSDMYAVLAVLLTETDSYGQRHMPIALLSFVLLHSTVLVEDLIGQQS